MRNDALRVSGILVHYDVSPLHAIKPEEASGAVGCGIDRTVSGSGIPCRTSALASLCAPSSIVRGYSAHHLHARWASGRSTERRPYRDGDATQENHAPGQVVSGRPTDAS